MPAPKGNQYAKGNTFAKGKATGRKSFRTETDIKRALNNMSPLVEKHFYDVFKKGTQEERTRVSKIILDKMLPNKTETTLEGNIDLSVVKPDAVMQKIKNLYERKANDRRSKRSSKNIMG